MSIPPPASDGGKDPGLDEPPGEDALRSLEAVIEHARPDENFGSGLNDTAPTPEFIRDLLCPDGQPRPGDEHLTGLGDALWPLDRDLQMDVSAALYTYAVERLTAAEDAEMRAKYVPPGEFRARALVKAERLARLWREACHARAADLGRST